MALACFLKDGTYSLNDGVLIPYVYDASRAIGGMTTAPFTHAGTERRAWEQPRRLATKRPQAFIRSLTSCRDLSPPSTGKQLTHAVLADHTQSNAPTL